MKKMNRFWLFLILAVVVYGVGKGLIQTRILNAFYSNMLILMIINIVLAASLHLVIGITGQFSIGHAGFLAVGAYASAIMTMKLSLPFPVALLVGGLAAAVAGLIIGIPSLRLKGDYL